MQGRIDYKAYVSARVNVVKMLEGILSVDDFYHSSSDSKSCDEFEDIELRLDLDITQASNKSS
eukprot:SAG31_NODE_1103_length_9895_cov_13.722540_1_plen_63_part_00